MGVRKAVQSTGLALHGAAVCHSPHVHDDLRRYLLSSQLQVRQGQVLLQLKRRGVQVSAAQLLSQNTRQEQRGRRAWKASIYLIMIRCASLMLSRTR